MSEGSDSSDDKSLKIKYLAAGAVIGFLLGIPLGQPFVVSSVGILGGVYLYSSKEQGS